MKFLVIRLKAIGDAILSLPVCASLKRTFPGAEVHYLLYEHIAPLFEGHPDVDRVIAVTDAERTSAWRYFRKMLALRRERYDAVLDLIALPASAVTTFLSGARQRVGFAHKPPRSWLYATRVPHPVDTDATRAKLGILEGLGVSVKYVTDFPRLAMRAEENQVQRARLLRAGVDFGRPVYAFLVASSTAIKAWPKEDYAAVIDACIARHGAQVVFVYGPGEKAHTEACAALVKDRSSVFPGIETRNLRELAALLANCDLYAGNDGGPRHVAEAVGLPTVTVFSPAVGKEAWLPNIDARHRAIDMREELGITRLEHKARLEEFTRNPWPYFRLIRPERVLREIDALVSHLARTDAAFGRKLSPAGAAGA